MVITLPLAIRSQKLAQRNHVTGPDGRVDLRALLVAISGYAILVVVTLSIQLIPALRQALGQFVIQGIIFA